MVIKLIAAVLLVFSASVVNAGEVTRSCRGNIETGDRKIVKAGVEYKISYEVNGTAARVRFAGREFDARAEKGTSWKGLWLRAMDNDIYFSYLPDEGGTIKLEFEPNRWFSGNC
ncbi:MAG: hypothetical protein U0236_21970 [Nitrospira sp.]